MNQQDRERYSRQIVLPSIGEEGQEALLASRALIVGMGGLGSAASMYLAAGGVGELVFSDYDRVDLSNMQRQIVHRHDHIGESKASSAHATLASINPDILLTALDWQLDTDELREHVHRADVVLDCTDNYETRFAINDACLQTQTPLVSGAALRLEGQLMTYLPKYEHSPCYRCLYRDAAATAATCSEEGILAPVVGVIGSLQALFAMQIIVGNDAHLAGKLILFDALHMDTQSVQMPRDPTCPACGTT